MILFIRLVCYKVQSNFYYPRVLHFISQLKKSHWTAANERLFICMTPAIVKHKEIEPHVEQCTGKMWVCDHLEDCLIQQLNDTVVRQLSGFSHWYYYFVSGLGWFFRFLVNVCKNKQGVPGWATLLRNSYFKRYLSIYNLELTAVLFKCNINIPYLTGAFSQSPFGTAWLWTYVYTQ